GSRCAEPRSFFTEDAAGVPVLVVRQEDGSLKAFLNVCRHRGAKVELDDCGRRNGFTCPYHAWSYKVDGTLHRVPYVETFGDVGEAASGLVELPVEERHGLVWVVLTPGASIDVAEHLGGLDGELASFGLDSYVVERDTLLRAELNWKIVVDGFLETYHLKFLHSRTIGPYIRTNLTPFEAFGPHGRMVGVRDSYDEVLGKTVDEADCMPHIAIIYQLFPNTILVWQADHFEAWLVFPEGDRPERSVSRVLLLASHPTRDESEQRVWDLNWKILMKTVLEEDFPVGETMQRGFAAGGSDHIRFGRNEPALQHFHRSLVDALGPLPTLR
ncbi:MAG TPA: aromatic ring-hydroxylating dioxygenase subunit alpha, partial [Acidimicrobiales bacterium]|nr:aromatic ring-hydroxylating dioxygenase subunit alpha [Acidimicrobiales bacterium]